MLQSRNPPLASLLGMIHDWPIGTDGNGSTVRSILFNNGKGFDLIDLRILVHMLYNLGLSIKILISSVTAFKEPN